jgi:hypothetical protein
MKKLSIEELEKIQNLNDVSPSDMKVVGILLKAINDWPAQIDNAEDLEIQVRDFVGGEATSKRIAILLKNIDFSVDAWKGESLSQLIEVFDFYDKEFSLADILKKLSIYVR